MTRAVFIDLNGTIVMPIDVQAPSHYRFIPGAADALKTLSMSGFLLPVVTIQSKIAKGIYSFDEFNAWFMQYRGDIPLLGPYVCPHRFSEDCICKKPKRYLFDRAIKEYDIDVSRSYMVGDGTYDMESAKNIGCKACLVMTGFPDKRGAEALADHVAADIVDAARWILSEA